MTRVPERAGQRSIRAMLGWYALIRVAVFAVALTVTVLLGVGGFLAAVIALAVSGLLTYPLGRRQRDEIVETMRNRRR